MADYSINALDVTSGFQAGASDEDVTFSIALMDGANACLEKNNVPESSGKALKIYGARHILTMQAGGGVRSESAPSGASRTYADVGASSYGKLLIQADRWGCVTGLLENDRRTSLWVVGRGR